MVIVTRRGLLLGASAVSVAGFLRPAMAQNAARTNHALLAACTAYPNLPQKVWLVGPNHDAVLVRDYLTKSSPVPFLAENVTVLADGVEGAAGSPTHQNILDNLGAIAAKAAKGDFVYIHLSGHGARQPAVDPDSETDGMDEIFLPCDTGKWEDGKALPNALLDNEIGSALDAIRNKGAFVWFVIDACHSGTATRAVGLSEDVMERQVEPDDLGIPAERIAAAEASAASRAVGPEGAPQASPTLGLTAGSDGAPTAEKAGLAAFYAAQTVETTPEMKLPRGAPDANRYGLFTFTIFSKLAENTNMTYRQLGQAVLQQYLADARQRPTPLFEGDLDIPVFGSSGGGRVLQWPIAVENGTLVVPAGLLHRLTPGSKLAVVAAAAADTATALGYVEVTSAENLSSQVQPVAFADKPVLGLDAIPPNAYARLTDLAVDFALVVGKPAPAEGLDAEVALVNTTLADLAAKPDKRFNIELVEPGQDADIRLAVMRENAIKDAAPEATDKPALWFISASGDVESGQERPPLVAIDPANPGKLADGAVANLEKIFRAVSLARLAAAMESGVSDVSVEFSIKRIESGSMEPMRAAVVPTVNPNDQVHIVAANNSSKHIDINILYVGSDYSITQMGMPERLAPGSTLKKGLLRFDDKSFGMERMVAVMTEAPPQSAIEDLKYLEQGGVPAVTRQIGSGPQGLKAMLSDIGTAPSTRSAMPLDEEDAGGAGAVMIFPLRNLPRA